MKSKPFFFFTTSNEKEGSYMNHISRRRRVYCCLFLNFDPLLMKNINLLSTQKENGKSETS